MAELELRRTAQDRHLYAIEGVGTVRLGGLFRRDATATAADGATWRFAPRGIFGSHAEATDAAGGVAGRFDARAIRRGGTLRWGERQLALRPSSMFRERYALADGERELAVLDGRSWGRTPVRITLADPAAIEAPLLLFAAFVVRRLAEDAGASAAGAASVAATSGS